MPHGAGVDRKRAPGAITQVVPKQKSGAHDVGTLIELLQEFPGMPLATMDVKHELGWSVYRTQSAIAMAVDQGRVVKREGEEGMIVELVEGVPIM